MRVLPKPCSRRHSRGHSYKRERNLLMRTALHHAVLFAAGILAFPSQAAALDDLTRGSVLYQEHCASCHGVRLEGQANWREQNPDGTMRAPPHDDTGHTWHHPDRLLRDYIRLGGEETLRRMGVTGVQSGMPGFADVLPDDDVTLILNFIKASWSERAAEYQSRITEQDQ